MKKLSVPFAALALVLVSCIYLPDVSVGPGTTPELELYKGINAERATADIRPLYLDTDPDRGLVKLARIRVQQMADQGYFAHVDPDGYMAYTELLRIFSYSYSWAGEVLALNSYALGESPRRALVSLMNSPSHRALILSDRYQRVGVGHITTADGRHIYAVIFLGVEW